MARPLRIEFAGALYHVTSRGDGREDIYAGEDDRELWLELLGQVCERFTCAIHAYCQMGNHYHLLVETPDANLAKKEWGQTLIFDYLVGSNLLSAHIHLLL